MTKLRLVAYREPSKVAEGCGFERQRRQGRHNAFKNSEGRIIVIPGHGGRSISPTNSINPTCLYCISRLYELYEPTL